MKWLPLAPSPRQAEPYFAFAAGETRFALPLDRVRAVLDAATLSSAPNLPASVVGVIDQGSARVPVLDLCEKLELPLAKGTSCIVLLETGSQQLALLGVAIDRVEHISIQVDKIEPLPQFARSRVACLGHVAYCAEELLLLLEPARLLSAAELKALAEMSGGGT